MSDHSIEPLGAAGRASSATLCAEDPSGFSRRSLLKGGSVGALAAMLASPLFAGAANAQTPTKTGRPTATGHRPTHTSKHKPGGYKRKPKPRVYLDTAGNYVPLQPIATQASCTLTQDFFFTEQVIVQDGDEVFPFVAPGGDVEALVLTSGSLSHLGRDLTQPSGWSFGAVTALTDRYGATTVQKVAVQNGPDGNAWAVCLHTSGGLSYSTMLTSASGSEWTVAYTQALKDTIADDADLRVAPSADGTTINFYAMATNGTVHTWPVLVDESWGGFYPGGDTPLATTIPGGGDLVGLLWDSGDELSGRGVLLALQDGVLNRYAQVSASRFSSQAMALIGGGGSRVNSVLYTGLSSDTTVQTPRVVVQMDEDGSGTGGGLYYSDVDGSQTELGVTYAQTLAERDLVTWVGDDGLFTFAFRDPGTDLVSVASQYRDDSGASQLGGVSPLQAGMTAVSAPSNDTAESTIFAVDAAECLNVFAKDTTGRWSLTPVHRGTGADPTPAVTEMDSWRVKISLFDATGAPLGLGQAQISADATIGLWQPTTHTVLTAGTPVTLTAGPSGHIAFNVPATDLSNTQLQVQPVDAAGNAAGPRFTVTPHVDVTRYLAGQVRLNTLATMSGPTLLGATGPDGSTMFPNLGKATDPTAAAAAFSDALTKVTTIGLGYAGTGLTHDFTQFAINLQDRLQPVVQTTTQTGSLDLDLPALETRRRAQLRARAAKHGTTLTESELGSIGSWWDSVKHDAESVWHAIKQGVIKVVNMTATLIKAGAGWAVTFLVDLGDGILHAIDTAITDVESAFRAVGNFFSALGSDLDAIVDWLKNGVLKLLKDVVPNATWFARQFDETIPNAFKDLLVNKIEKPIDNFFASKETEVQQAFTTLADKVSGTQLGSKNPPSANNDQDTGSNTIETVLSGLGQVNKILKYVDGQWLMDKLEDYLSPDAGTQNLPSSADIDAAIAELVDVMGTIGDVFSDLGTTVYDAFEVIGQSNSALAKADEGALITSFGDVAVDLLKLADEIVDIVIDLMLAVIDTIAEFCNAEVPVPLLGEVFKMAGLAEPKFSFGLLLGLIAAFPATLITGALGYPLIPGASVSTGLAAAEDSGVMDPWACALNWLSFPVQAGWTLVDSAENCNQGKKDEEWGKPGYFWWVDLLAPLALTALQWPAAPVDGKTPGFLGDPDWDGPDGAMIPWFLLAGITPSLVAAGEAFFTKSIDADGAFATYCDPLVQTICGIAGIVLTSLWNWENDQSDWAKAIGIMGGLSYADAFCSLKVVGDATNGVSYVIKWVVDAFTGIGCTAGFIDTAIAS